MIATPGKKVSRLERHILMDTQVLWRTAKVTGLLADGDYTEEAFA